MPLPPQLTKLILSYLPLNRVFDAIVDFHVLPDRYLLTNNLIYEEIAELNAVLAKNSFSCQNLGNGRASIIYNNFDNIITIKNIINLLSVDIDLYNTNIAPTPLNILLMEVRSPVMIIKMKNKILITKVDLTDSILKTV